MTTHYVDASNIECRGVEFLTLMPARAGWPCWRIDLHDGMYVFEGWPTRATCLHRFMTRLLLGWKWTYMGTWNPRTMRPEKP